jgi:hypothetical protein
MINRWSIALFIVTVLAIIFAVSKSGLVSQVVLFCSIGMFYLTLLGSKREA